MNPPPIHKIRLSHKYNKEETMRTFSSVDYETLNRRDPDLSLFLSLSHTHTSQISLFESGDRFAAGDGSRPRPNIRSTSSPALSFDSSDTICSRATHAPAHIGQNDHTGVSRPRGPVFSTPIQALTGTHTGTKQKFELYIVLDLGSSNRSGMHFSPLLTGRPLIFSTGIFAPTYT